MEPDASSRTTSRRGLSLRLRQTSSSGVPPWAMLRVDGAAQVETPAAAARPHSSRQPRAHGLRQTRGQSVGRGELSGSVMMAEVGAAPGSRRDAAPSAAPARSRRLALAGFGRSSGAFLGGPSAATQRWD